MQFKQHWLDMVAWLQFWYKSGSSIQHTCHQEEHTAVDLWFSKMLYSSCCMYQLKSVKVNYFTAVENG